jgi:hypothetical protein
MAADDSFWVARTTVALEALDDIEHRMNRFRRGSEEGSPASRDAARRAGYYAWSFAAAGIQVSHDHLSAWRFLHNSAPQVPFAHWTLLRASIEGSAVTRWICGGPAGASAGRGVGAQQADFEQRQGFEGRMKSAMPWAPPPQVDAVTRVKELRAEAEEAGIVPVRFPGSTRLIASTLPGADLGGVTIDSEVLYRLLSAAAHSRMWGMPILGDATRGQELASAPQLADTSLTAPADIVWLLTKWSVTCLARALSDFEAYGRAPA